MLLIEIKSKTSNLFENNFLDISIYDCKLYSKMCDKLDIMKCIEKRKIKFLTYKLIINALNSKWLKKCKKNNDSHII